MEELILPAAEPTSREQHVMNLARGLGQDSVGTFGLRDNQVDLTAHDDDSDTPMRNIQDAQSIPQTQPQKFLFLCFFPPSFLQCIFFFL